MKKFIAGIIVALMLVFAAPKPAQAADYTMYQVCHLYWFHGPWVAFEEGYRYFDPAGYQEYVNWLAYMVGEVLTFETEEELNNWIGGQLDQFFDSACNNT